MKRHSVVFLVSDFLAGGYERSLRVANRRHDVVAIRVVDRREEEIPPIGTVEFEDSESGDRFLLNTSSAGFAEAFKKLAAEADEKRKQTFKSMGVDFVQGCHFGKPEPLQGGN